MTGKFIPHKADVANSLYVQAVILVLAVCSHGGKRKKDGCNEYISYLLALSGGMGIFSSQATQQLCSLPVRILPCKDLF